MHQQQVDKRLKIKHLGSLLQLYMLLNYQAACSDITRHHQMQSHAHYLNQHCSGQVLHWSLLAEGLRQLHMQQWMQL